MCINPVLLPNGQEVACHHCWQCIKRKVDDWTGRCIAESQTSVITRSVTLTYGRDDLYNSADHMRAACLTYSDFQQYMRSMRDAGYQVRYFVVGEYGSMKGRAHWHAVLFFSGTKLPLRPLGRNIEDEHWPHGHSFWDEAFPETIQYVTKYITKTADDDAKQCHMALSKKPPLGDAWFKQYAQRFVEHRLAPQDAFYSFDGVLDKKGHKRVFVMSGATLENFLASYVEQWAERYGDHVPNSDLVEKYLDAVAAKGSPEAAKAAIAAEKAHAPGARLEALRRDAFTGVVRKPSLDDMRSWMDPKRLEFVDELAIWRYNFEGGQRPWYWAKDRDGVYGWRSAIGAGHPVPGANSYQSAKGA